MVRFFLFVLAVFASFPLANASDDPKCLTPLSEATREQPWPEAPKEMIEALKAMPAPRMTESQGLWNQAIARADADQFIHGIFGDLPFDRIRQEMELLPPKEVEVPGVAKISFFGGSLPENTRQMREALAKSIRAIVSDEVKIQWMRFLAQDPTGWVREDAVNAFTTLSSQELRDAWAMEWGLNASKSPDPKQYRRYGIARGLSSVSPALRFRIIKGMASRGSVGELAAKALDSLLGADPIRLAAVKAWFEDMQANRFIDESLQRYNSWSLKDKLGGHSMHEMDAMDVSKAVQTLQNRELRLRWIAQLEAMAAVPQGKGLFAHDILKGFGLRRLSQEYLDFLRRNNVFIPTLVENGVPNYSLIAWEKDPVRAQWRRKFVEAAGGVEAAQRLEVDDVYIRFAVEKRLEEQRKPWLAEEKPYIFGDGPLWSAPRKDAWTLQDITAFEASLR